MQWTPNRTDLVPTFMLNRDFELFEFVVSQKSVSPADRADLRQSVASPPAELACLNCSAVALLVWAGDIVRCGRFHELSCSQRFFPDPKPRSRPPLLPPTCGFRWGASPRSGRTLAAIQPASHKRESRGVPQSGHPKEGETNSGADPCQNGAAYFKLVCRLRGSSRNTALPLFHPGDTF